MSVDLPPYPAIKDSAVAWLGEVPDHWTTERLKSSMHNIVEQTTERRAADLYVALEHVESWTGRLRHAGLDVSFDSQVKCFRSGDVLFGKLRPYLAKVTRPTSDGNCVGEFLVLRPRHSNATAPYMEQLLRSKPIIDAVNSSTFGAKMPRADWQFMGGMAIALPPLPEQAAIVRFLDHADRRIRRYIRAQQQLIALLEEQKQAIIHQAVTGQIDVRTCRPYPAYKPSGVEELGDVPEHWEVVALKRMLTRLIDCEHKTAPAVSASDNYVVRTTAVRAGTIRWEGTYCTDGSSYMEWTKRGVPQVGDVIFTREAPAGEACLVPKWRRVCLGQRTVLLKPRPTRYDAAFLVHMIYAGPPRLRVQLASQGSTVSHFNVDDIGRMPVLAPPLEEQATIVEVLRRHTGGIDRARQVLEREVRLLQEYHARLIADVVTGKFDVREAAARLPDEVEEQEPLDEADALIDGEEEPTDDLATAP